MFSFFLILVPYGTVLLYLQIDAGIDYYFYAIAELFICFFSLMRLAEHLAALSKVESVRSETAEKFAAIIPAYLPSEQHSIVKTIEHFLSLDYPLEIIVPYNTPDPLPVEAELARLPIIAVKVPNSKSKAENINYILDKIETKYVAIFDADHRPLAENFPKALGKLKEGYDIVQGSCLPLVDSETNTGMRNILNIEFNQMYNVNHKARQILWDFAIFGGSNGYFKSEVLKTLSFDHRMLTEDIDLTIRALIDNKKIAFDSGIVSYEQPPQNIRELWKQRTRWAQGWLQVSWKYGFKLWCPGNELSCRQKLGLFLLLPVREVGQFIALQVLPIFLAISLQNQECKFSNLWIAVFAINIALLLLEPIWIFLVRDRLSASKPWFIAYSFASLFYMYLLGMVSLYAYYRQAIRNTKFEVTQKCDILVTEKQ